MVGRRQPSLCSHSAGRTNIYRYSRMLMIVLLLMVIMAILCVIVRVCQCKAAYEVHIL